MKLNASCGGPDDRGVQNSHTDGVRPRLSCSRRRVLGTGQDRDPTAPAARLTGYGSMPSLRSSTIAVRRQRIVSGENGSVNGMPFALRSGFPSRRPGSAPGSTRRSTPRLQAGERLTHVLPHLAPRQDCCEKLRCACRTRRGRRSRSVSRACSPAARLRPAQAVGGPAAERRRDPGRVDTTRVILAPHDAQFLAPVRFRFAVRRPGHARRGTRLHPTQPATRRAVVGNEASRHGERQATVVGGKDG